MLKVIDEGCVVQQRRHVILHFIQRLLNDVSGGLDEGIDLTVRTLSNLQEDDGASANDLVDHESGHDDEEDGAEGESKVELSSEDVLVGLLDEVAGDLAYVLLVVNLLISQEL